MLAKYVLAVALTAPLFAACGGECCDSSSANASSSTSKSDSAVKIVTPVELSKLRETTPGMVILDANPKKIFDAGHVPGARFMPDDRSALPADKNALVVFYCYNETCGASHAAAKDAIAAGYTNVARMSAGIEGWKAAGFPVEK